MARFDWLRFAAPLALTAAAAAGAQDVTAQADGRYLVKFRDFNNAAQAVAAMGGRVALELEPQRTIAAYLPEHALNGLRNNPNVEYVEVDPRRYLMSQTTPYGIPMVQADQLTAPNQAGVTVCIIDSGYHRGHEDLQDGNVSGVNNPGTGSWDQDSCGHGSHVAGTIAALNNAVGVVGVNGNGALNLQIQKVFDGASCGWAYSSGLVSALNNCRNSVATGQRLVVSMSLGGNVSSKTEQAAFQNAYDAGVLSVAAAGNDGSTRRSYPASYPSVISVAAVDSAGVVADFSQRNDAVELAAPGVAVLSTTPFKVSSLAAGSSRWVASNIDGSARSAVSGALVSGGLCDATNSAWAGKVVLCQRGTNTFADKVGKVQASAGVGAAIYNNVDGGFSGTLNGTSTIPAVSMSKADGEAALAAANGTTTATLDNEAGVAGQSYSGYEYYDGTSMATPHVSGVAALVWSYFPSATNAQIRDALQKSARDLGAAGKDTATGYGLVQAKDAYAYLLNPPVTLAVTKVRSGGKYYADLKWTGLSGATVFYYRNNSGTSTANDGVHRDGPLASGSYTYRVCDSSNGTCTSSVTVTY